MFIVRGWGVIRGCIFIISWHLFSTCNKGDSPPFSSPSSYQHINCKILFFPSLAGMFCAPLFQFSLSPGELWVMAAKEETSRELQGERGADHALGEVLLMGTSVNPQK